MSRSRAAVVALMSIVTGIAAVFVNISDHHHLVSAQGVGRASWTPSTSVTEFARSRFIVPDDSITYWNESIWSGVQVDGLRAYANTGLHYTHEVNDRTGRLSATGYWATNLPDPAFDRDDDDGDLRWEEAEIIAGAQVPTAGSTYSSLVQFSRWHSKRQNGACVWAWDRRLGTSEVLSQLSRDLLGEWQAERFTLTYDSLAYPRVEPRPEMPAETPVARCREIPARPSQSGIVVTFNEPIAWEAFIQLQDIGFGRWTAWEAIGSRAVDQLTWTCGGPVHGQLGVSPCEDMGMAVQGVTAAVGYYDEAAINALRSHGSVAQVDGLRDAVTSLLQDVGGLGVEPAGLTVNDAYWELFLPD